MSTPVSSTSPESLATAMQGIWWLVSREDYTKDGQRRIDPVLGSDPIGILSYAKDRFSAQFMKRDRTEGSGQPVFGAGQNNTSAVGGYDAYFGTYVVDKRTGTVAHTLVGSITAANIGMTVYRNLKVENNRLTIQLETSTPEGEGVVRTLVWERIS